MITQLVTLSITFAATPLLSNYQNIWVVGLKSEQLIIRNVAQRGCECTEANYSLYHGIVKVRNTCVRDGTFTEIIGQAVAVSNSEFQVSFPNVPQPPVEGVNYIILNVWEKNGVYERALVVAPIPSFIPEPEREASQFIWILARKSAISESEIAETLDYVTKAGYNPVLSNWQRTEQVTCRAMVPR